MITFLKNFKKFLAIHSQARVGQVAAAGWSLLRGSVSVLERKAGAVPRFRSRSRNMRAASRASRLPLISSGCFISPDLTTVWDKLHFYCHTLYFFPFSTFIVSTVVKIETSTVAFVLFSLPHLLFMGKRFLSRGRIQRKIWCMGPCAGVDYNLIVCRLQSRLQHMYHWEWATLCQSRLYPPARDSWVATDIQRTFETGWEYTVKMCWKWDRGWECNTNRQNKYLAGDKLFREVHLQCFCFQKKCVLYTVTEQCTIHTAKRTNSWT